MQLIKSFIGGYEFEFYTVLHFRHRLDDEWFRTLIDPNLFIFQIDTQLELFKINYNPKPEQLKALRRFLDIVKGRSSEINESQLTYNLLRIQHHEDATDL